jgi:hypothetical protein
VGVQPRNSVTVFVGWGVSAKLELPCAQAVLPRVQGAST